MIALLVSLLFTPTAPAKFDDAALRARLTASAEEKSKLLIYTWSPQMPLSVKGLAELMETKGKRDYRVLVLLDDGANTKVAAKVAKDHKWPAAVLERNESLELRKQGSRLHYPSYVFVKDGKYVGALLPGYRNHEELADLAARKF